MKIRMKVKHLVLVAVGILLFIPLTAFVIGPQIELHFAEKKLTQGKMEGKERILESLNSTILQSQKWDIIQEHMIEGDVAYRFDVYTGPSSTQVNLDHSKVRFTWSEKLPYIKEYVEDGPVNGYLTNAATYLSSYYQQKGQLEQADQVLKKTAERFSAEQFRYNRQELLLERIKIAINQSKYDEAEKYIKEINDTLKPEDNEMNAEIARLRAESISRQGNLDDAYQEVKNALAEYEEKMQGEVDEHPELSGGNLMVFDQLQSLERHLNIAINMQGDSAVSVKGKVIRNDGRPVKNAGVFLRKEINVNHSINETESYQVLTDENGNYEFQDVIPGSYQMNLGFTFDQIDGWTWPVETDEWIDVDGSKNLTYDITLQELLEVESPINRQNITEDTVHFAWEEVEEAAYYNLSLSVDIDGGSISSGFKSTIKDTQLTVPVEEIYAKQMGILLGDEEYVQPLSLLGFSNPKNRLSWSIDAYNSEGELITRSNGYRLNEDTIGNLPFFYLKNRELTDADRLLMDKKKKEALSAYIENYEKDPTDMHSLRMIVRLIGMKGDGTEETRDELVYPYVKALAEQTAYSDDVYHVINYHYRNRQWESFNRWFDKYADLQDGNLSEYVRELYAGALMMQGKLVEASKQFEETMKQDNSNRSVGNWIAVEMYLNESFDSALKIAGNYPERPFAGEHRDWGKMVMNLEEESSQYSNYYQKLKDVLDLYFDNQEEKLNDWLKTTDKVAMKTFIKSVREID